MWNPFSVIQFVDADSFNIFKFCSVMGVILLLFAIAGVVPTTPKSVMAIRMMHRVLDLTVHCLHSCLSVDILQFATDDPDLRTQKKRRFDFHRAF